MPRGDPSSRCTVRLSLQSGEGRLIPGAAALCYPVGVARNMPLAEQNKKGRLK